MVCSDVWSCAKMQAASCPQAYQGSKAGPQLLHVEGHSGVTGNPQAALCKPLFFRLSSSLCRLSVAEGTVPCKSLANPRAWLQLTSQCRLMVTGSTSGCKFFPNLEHLETAAQDW